MPPPRFMTKAQWLNRYGGWRGSIRLWRDFFADLRAARALRNRPRYVRPRSAQFAECPPMGGIAYQNMYLAQQAAYQSSAGLANAQQSNYQHGLAGLHSIRRDALSQILGFRL